MDALACKYHLVGKVSSNTLVDRLVHYTARAKLQYVVGDGSYGAHNIAYVSAILDSAEAEIENCLSLTAQWTKAGPEESRR